MVVAFFTRDSIYETEKNRLLRSAQRLGLAVDAEPIESTGSWVRNASMKPSVLVAMRRKHAGPMLYVDVDAVFHRDPWPALAALDCDIAAYYEPQGHLLSGTLFINHTPAATALLQAWAQACAENPDEWDQLVLERLLDSDAARAEPRYRLARLPVAYCWIFDKTDNAPCDRSTSSICRPAGKPRNASACSAGRSARSGAGGTGCARSSGSCSNEGARQATA
ncbi:putative nucleotide-diphospho-sugar transferase [Achromobacter xylosoxidans]